MYYNINVRKYQKKGNKNMKKKNSKKIMYLKILTLIIISIFLNNTFVKANDDIVVSPENWNEWQKREYWEWYTRTTTDDKAYNGEHIVIENNIIDFYGYGQNSYKDFLYKKYENPGKKIFKFVLDETKANYHTLDGAGFIFNAKKVDNKLSGYVVLFRKSDICIYRLDNVDIERFGTEKETTLATYGKLIYSVDKSDTTIRELTLEATPTYIKIQEGTTEIVNLKLDYSIHVGESFGLIASYTQHDCSKLSQIQFYEISITLEDYTIKVINTDLEENRISGGQFILKDENGKTTKEGTTNSKGEFEIEGLQEGIYTVEQKKEPSGYILNNNIYKFKVTNEGKVIDVDTGKEIELIVKNEKIKNEEETASKEDTNNKEEKKESNESNKNISNISNKGNTTIEKSTTKDSTTSSKVIPKAGTQTKILVISIVTMIGLSVILYIKQKQYK